MKVSVNADDFGISEEVSRTIADFIRKGYCNTTTVMVNMREYEKCHDIAVDEGITDRVGLHICLTEGMPITKSISDSPVFVQNGLFGCYKKHRFQRFVLGGKTKRAVRDEIRAQIERYLRLGYTGMTMDSHQGIHMDWSIYPIVTDLFEEYGFKYLRRSPNLKNDFTRRIIRLPFDAALSSRNIPHFDCMGNFRDFRDNLDRLEKSGKTVEIMCHPKGCGGTVYIDWCSGLLLDGYMEEISACAEDGIRYGTEEKRAGF